MLLPRSCFLFFVAASLVTVEGAEARDNSRTSTTDISTTTMFQKVLDVTPVFVKSRPGAFGLVAAGVGGGLFASLGWRKQETGPTAACKALGASARVFKKTPKVGGRVSVKAYAEALEVLMPAFRAYGVVFDRAFRKDVLGNIIKLRKLLADSGEDDLETLIQLDPHQDLPHVSVARAVFWLNRIAQQIAVTFQRLLDDEEASLVACATTAYLATCAPYNTRAHQTMARIMLKIIPTRQALVQIYGFPSEEFEKSLAPYLREWVVASRVTRTRVDAIFERHRQLTPKRNRPPANFKPPKVAAE